MEKTLRIGDFGLRIADCGLITMNPDDMKKRTKAYALAIIRFVQTLPATPTARLIGNQLLKCGTSVGANYRASCRAKSRADFIAKMGIVEEEGDESLYWMELLVDSGIVSSSAVAELCDEGDQIVAIVVSSINTARGTKR
ncbi:MAG TPA: four helix bundle protein [Blastocatellia bacterium]|nr:four helix bundle protein [Blastocatellia bacterium]